MTEPAHRNHVLDGYRAVAALGVVTTHVAFQTGAVGHGQAGALLARLDLGVALFFVLSGYVLYRSYARALFAGVPLPSLRRYLRHRGFRILPAYWVVVLVALATAASAYRSGDELVRQLFLLQTFTPGHLLPALTQMWSLATEVCFYLVLPGYAALLARIPAHGPRARFRLQVVGVVLLAVVAPVWGLWVLGLGHLNPQVAMLWLPAHLDWFAAGMLVAILREYEPIRPGGGPADPPAWWRTLAASPGACWGAAAAVLVIASTPVAGPLTLDPTTALRAVTKELLYLVIATLVLIAGAWPESGSWLVRLFTAGPLQALGRWSYGLFLWHLLALELVLRVLGRAPFTGGFWVVLLLTTGLGIGAAAASWVFLEEPVQRWREPRAQTADQGADRG